MKVIQATTWSFEPFDKLRARGEESFSVSRFGYEYLKELVGKGYSVVTPKDGFWTRLFTKLIKSEGRNLILQLTCAIKANKVDLLYYPTDRHAWLLAILRKIRVCRTPILMVSHFTFNTTCVDSRWKKLFLKFERSLIFHSIDRVVFASERLLELAKEDYNIPEKDRTFVGWGADLNFFHKRGTPPIYDFPYFLSAGGVNRDYLTLITAFKNLKYNLVLSCNPKTLKMKLPPNVHIFDYSKQGSQASVRLRNLYQNCKAVLLPISRGNHVPNGASVLVESIACGKPVIISDLKSNFVDVEKEGIGYTVKMHDSQDWIDKVEKMAMTDDYQLMVDNCKKLALEYNYETFAHEIYDIMVEMTSRKSSK